MQEDNNVWFLSFFHPRFFIHKNTNESRIVRSQREQRTGRGKGRWLEGDYGRGWAWPEYSVHLKDIVCMKHNTTNVEYIPIKVKTSLHWLLIGVRMRRTSLPPTHLYPWQVSNPMKNNSGMWKWLKQNHYLFILRHRQKKSVLKHVRKNTFWFSFLKYTFFLSVTNDNTRKSGTYL